MKINHYILSFIFCAFAGSVSAQKLPTNILYLGGGVSTHKDIYSTKDTPYSIGYLSTSDENPTVWGLDLANEGTLLDSTWGQKNAITSGTSFNGLFGYNLSINPRYRIDLALLMGARSKSEDCPKSYLGYQCYADSKPNVTYAFNYGAVLAFSYDKFMIGARATKESRQLILGFRF